MTPINLWQPLPQVPSAWILTSGNRCHKFLRRGFQLRATVATSSFGVVFNFGQPLPQVLSAWFSTSGNRCHKFSPHGFQLRATVATSSSAWFSTSGNRCHKFSPHGFQLRATISRSSFRPVCNFRKPFPEVIFACPVTSGIRCQKLLSIEHLLCKTKETVA